MQGAAGMIDQPQGYVRRVRELTQKYGILLVFDEVATGFGRTGRMFACEHEQVVPDILIAAKGLTGGYLPLAVTMVTETIYRAFCGSYTELKTFFHGHTYTANPLACSVALANLKLFESRDVLRALVPKMELLQKKLQGFLALKQVGDIRRVGMMAGLELVRDRKTQEAYALSDKIGIRVIQQARAKGAILRPLGSVIVLMPPLGMTEAELETLLDITYASIQEVTEAP